MLSTFRFPKFASNSHAAPICQIVFGHCEPHWVLFNYPDCSVDKSEVVDNTQQRGTWTEHTICE